MSASYPRDPLPPDAFTAPAWHYTDPGRFRDEMECFFGRGWFYAGREEEVAEPGSYRLIEAAGESLILLRDREGALRCFFNVCRHRGTRLCEAPAGQLGETIRCPYHAWTFRLDGGLAGAPHMDLDGGFRKEDYPLISARVASWDGLMWVNFAQDAPPLESYLGGLTEAFDDWEMGSLCRGARRVYDVRANWKLIIQNYSECLHCPTNHPLLKKVAHYLSGKNEPAHPAYLGGSMDLLDGAQTMSTTGRRRRVLGSVSGDAGRRVYFYAVLPNLLLSPHPDYLLTHLLRPLAADRTEIICEWHYHPDDLAGPGFDPSPEVEFWDQTNREDWHLSELMQRGLSSRAYRPGPYSPREDLLHGFDRILRERMGEI